MMNCNYYGFLSDEFVDFLLNNPHSDFLFLFYKQVDFIDLEFVSLDVIRKIW